MALLFHCLQRDSKYLILVSVSDLLTVSNTDGFQKIDRPQVMISTFEPS